MHSKDKPLLPLKYLNIFIIFLNGWWKNSVMLIVTSDELTLITDHNIYIYIYIARKTYRFRETVGMFIVKKMWKNVSGSYQSVNGRKFKRGNAMEKKWRKGERRRKKNPHRVGEGQVVVEMNRWSQTDHTQSQQTVPLFTEGIERKGSPTLLDGKSNVSDSEYWIIQH